MKFVYVIVSQPEDYILEQALISMHSMRMFNPDAHITAVMDQDTSRNLSCRRDRIKRYVNNILTPKIPAGLSNSQKSRFLKTSLREIVSGDFLYLDNDTIITDSLKDLEEFPFDVAAVSNMHRDDWNRENPHPMEIEYLNLVGNDISKELKFTEFFNGGVIFSKDTPEAHFYFKKWHELWLIDTFEYGFVKDQISMWRANYLLDNIIKNLDDCYNCQIIYPVYALKHFETAKILHYISSSKISSHLKFNNIGFLKKIREFGVKEDDEKFLKYFKSWYQDFLNTTIETALVNYHLDRTPVSYLGKRLSERFPWFNKPIQAFTNAYVKIKKN